MQVPTRKLNQGPGAEGEGVLQSTTTPLPQLTDTHTHTPLPLLRGTTEESPALENRGTWFYMSKVFLIISDNIHFGQPSSSHH